MADPVHTGVDPTLVDLLKSLAVYAPGLAGAVFSMAWGQNLTIRGKLLSGAVGVASAVYLAPLICDLIDWTVWPGEGVPTNLTTAVGFCCGLFGMILLAGLAEALAKYSKDPLSLVRIQIGGTTISGAGNNAGSEGEA